MSDDLVERAEAALDGVMQGRWFVSPGGTFTTPWITQYGEASPTKHYRADVEAVSIVARGTGVVCTIVPSLDDRAAISEADLAFVLGAPVLVRDLLAEVKRVRGVDP